MFCAIYRSLTKADTYLYIEKKDDFSPVPDLLLQSFGKPQLVMVINLTQRSQLATTDTASVRRALIETGYYLQLPLPVKNLLTTHVETKTASD